MVFKAYDIRGKYKEEVNEELFGSIAKSLHVLGDVGCVVIGCDMRNSSPALKQAFIDGLIDTGIDVIDIGLASTPILYHATGYYDVDIGVIITASHNPSEDNGLKLCRKNAIPIAWDSGIEDIKNAVENQNFINSTQKGRYRKEDFSPHYISDISKYGKKHQNLNVVFDAGNAMGGFVDDDILDEFCSLDRLYCDLDGNFPNHEANPIKEETLKDLKQRVIETKADVGFAVDGDGDRLGVVDEKGQFIPADLIAAFLTNYYIREYPDEDVYSFDLRSTKFLKELVESKGKNYLQTRVGHSFIKRTMREYGSFFSCELSGHYYFWFGDDLVYDSAIRTALEILGILQEQDRPLSECIEQFRKYWKSPETNFSVTNKEKVLEAIKKEYSDASIEEIDGLTFVYDTWWFNIRASNTENTLRVNFESNSKELYDEYFEGLCSFIEEMS